MPMPSVAAEEYHVRARCARKPPDRLFVSVPQGNAPCLKIVMRRSARAEAMKGIYRMNMTDAFCAPAWAKWRIQPASNRKFSCRRKTLFGAAATAHATDIDQTIL
jgi:hypothetical protein